MQESLVTDKDFVSWVLLFQVRDMVFKLREKELHQYGISVEEASVMFVLQILGDKATPAGISRWLIREHHSVLGILSRMERKGLVKKTKNLERKNMIRVVLTDKGQQAYHQSIKREPIHGIMSSLSEDERQQIILLLEKLRHKALEALGIEQKPAFPCFTGF